MWVDRYQAWRATWSAAAFTIHNHGLKWPHLLARSGSSRHSANADGDGLFSFEQVVESGLGGSFDGDWGVRCGRGGWPVVRFVHGGVISRGLIRADLLSVTDAGLMAGSSVGSLDCSFWLGRFADGSCRCRSR